MVSAKENAALQPPRSADHVSVWLSDVFEAARRAEATDLHFFPAEAEGALWMRIDGHLHEAVRYPRAIHDRAMARLRVLARCPDYVRDAVTEGRFSVTVDAASGRRTEARLSIVPGLQGEKAVVRLLGDHLLVPALDKLGFSPELVATLAEAGARPQGLMLVVGPAGSGKSTTLASLMACLYNDAESPLAVLTLEDPPEIPLPFATQVAVEPARGLSFAEGLRALLRQDPELIMVGEIRDPETAQVALNAALTGHRLFSTMHTMNAGEALVRLQDMGAAPYLLVSALGGVLNQRLVRRPCPECTSHVAATDVAESSPFAAALADSDPTCTVAQSAGCEACQQIGYRGRTALGEWASLGAEAAELLAQRRGAKDLQRALERPHSFHSEGLHLLRQHQSTPHELDRLLAIERRGRGIYNER